MSSFYCSIKRFAASTPSSRTQRAVYSVTLLEELPTGTLGLVAFPAGGPGIDRLGEHDSILGRCSRPHGRGRSAQRTACLRGIRACPRRGRAGSEPIGASGTTGTTVLRWPLLTEEDSASGMIVTWPLRMKATSGQLAEARDRVGGAGERLVKERRFGRRGADRRRPAQCSASSCSRADVAEVALVDRERFRKGDRERLDVGVARDGSSGRICSAGFAARLVALLPPTWRIVIFGLKRQRRAVVGVEVGGEVRRSVPWSPIPCESTRAGQQLVGLIVKLGRSMLTWIERIRIGMPPMI